MSLRTARDRPRCISEVAIAGIRRDSIWLGLESLSQARGGMLDSRHVFKVEPTGFTNRLDMGVKQRRVMDDTQIFHL